MRFCETILKHIMLRTEMEKACVPDSLLKDYKEEELQDLSRKINQMEVGEQIGKLGEEAASYLVRDQGFLSCLVRLSKEECYNPVRTSSFLSSAGDAILSEDYAYEELLSALADDQIEPDRICIYLKYFRSVPLTEEEKGHLMMGLYTLDECDTFSIGDLTDRERRLLTEPMMSSNFLKKMAKERSFWKRLLDPGYHGLIKGLSDSLKWRACLMQRQEKVLWDHKEAISTGLSEVLKRIPPEEAVTFLVQWLDNEALVYDLNRLKHLLLKVSADKKLSFMKNRVSYLSFLYGDVLEGVNVELLSEDQNNLLVYAITHKKKHFLSVVRENFRDFTYFGWHNLLLDRDTYERFLNINTLNPRNLRECARLYALSDDKKQVLTWGQYTFEEIRLFATNDIFYIKLYHRLADLKMDDRLRVIREIIGKKCLLEGMTEEQLDKLGMMLKEKPVSRWMETELKHVESLSYQQAVSLLCVWDEAERFIPEIRTGYHADFLVYNLEKLQDIPDFKTAKEQMPEIDGRWKQLNGVLKIGEDFLFKNREGFMRFLCEGGAEIFHAFLSGALESEREKAKRLCAAEIAGRFREVKYYKNDLEREIALHLPAETQQVWMKNMEVKRKPMRLWEEDRLLPIMQIGEVLGHTCLSYRDGKYKSCLLSCFDANKKVIYLSMEGTLVFRAIIRLTKGTFYRTNGKRQGLQFADLTQEDAGEEAANDRKEYLTLFLERPYFKGVSEEKEKEAVWFAVEMLKKKAKQLQAELVLSDAYKKFALEEKQFIRAKYYMYISESKNGEQYLDSLGGMAGARQEGSYEEGYFLFQESFVNPRTEK
ncbi:hypothetical protein EBB54_12365 [Schaedlerella arabinosiphila]|uniref:DUF4132 domain-containing protein n=1 Tax=Schaedlerella arabinosiphila TaxID=2044587 RepID=A0A426DH37_9FIRM|nr:hypothetical protein [Schaedlerella arabinosiphila]RRK32074.1 hypothetical protein EBB54_12365 [Schaedlerella arabinosiphila]